MPIAELPQNPPAKSWYVIIGGLFEGIRFENYDREIRQDVERYANCRAYGPGAGSLTKQQGPSAYATHANNVLATTANRSRQRR
eukprot:3533268-Pleurochrysis_carterae.AAC.1